MQAIRERAYQTEQETSGCRVSGCASINQSTQSSNVDRKRDRKGKGVAKQNKKRAGGGTSIRKQNGKGVAKLSREGAQGWRLTRRRPAAEQRLQSAREDMRVVTEGEMEFPSRAGRERKAGGLPGVDRRQSSVYKAHVRVGGLLWKGKGRERERESPSRAGRERKAGGSLGVDRRQSSIYKAHVRMGGSLPIAKRGKNLPSRKGTDDCQIGGCAHRLGREGGRRPISGWRWNIPVALG
ncbi:hypothetical protein BJ322DRAFT_1018317 [Thelephora terrestris]|uniref:Uncharacterized protein n=1 Tax=Thelephora terrestris TaxID=56493 RepID=A0A9P6HMV7_9AGAM|nr:hypothetical protein BJ322DRAFT_1018317 [Thelephora terrestris]